MAKLRPDTDRTPGDDDGGSSPTERATRPQITEDQARAWAAQRRPAPATDRPDPSDVLYEGAPDRPLYPDVLGNDLFWLVYRPSRWDALERGDGTRMVLPVLTQHSATPGSNGMAAVDLPGKPRRVDSRSSFADLARNSPGAIVLPLDIDGPGTSYLRWYACGETVDRRTGQTRPVRHWCTRWETLYPGTSARSVDSVGYTTWLRGLVDRGVVPLAAEHVLVQLLQDYTGRQARLIHKHGTSHPEHETFAAYSAALVAIREELARVRAAVSDLVPAESELGTADDILS